MATARRDLTALYGIGKKRAALLRSLGIGTYEDLLDCDLRELGWELSRHDGHVTMAMMEGLRAHARSYAEDRPLLYGELPDIGERYLVVDLEYEPFRSIWLIGVLLVDGTQERRRHLWADDDEAERRNLETLAHLLRSWSPRPVLTWAGHRADLPQLRDAARRHRLRGLFKGAFGGHVDLFAHCERSLRLPQPGLGLGAVSSFFGFEDASTIHDGLEALRLYRAYREICDREARARLRAELLAYNGEDLRALAATERALRALPPLRRGGRPGATRRHRRSARGISQRRL